ncbi:hypothetical protein [Oleiagrimonas sp.]|jgi:hypothetical protein|uniref:hypothetical protein n=1 Tax=Oleiagrimonas sp. TaxID=2010330 RepID=UPI00260CC5D9|nr:hypothetical protein [Oleiagrimonas sp.]MDA3912759.1 hypothetical protein [Oleiagrimonas sp.]
MKLVRSILLAALAGYALSAMAALPGDEAAAKQTVYDDNAAWATHDVVRYRRRWTNEDLILDNGEISNLDQDVADLRTHPQAWWGASAMASMFSTSNETLVRNCQGFKC